MTNEESVPERAIISERREAAGANERQDRMNTTTNEAKKTECPTCAIRKVARKGKRERLMLAVHDDPSTELRRLVKEHATHTRQAVALGNMYKDKKNRETGVVIPCRLADDVRAALANAEKSARDHAAMLESAMARQLRQLPIYKHFLSRIYGMGDGPIAAYLASEIDIHRCVKPSQLTRYCGFAVINGRLERRSADANPHDVARYMAEGMDLKTATKFAKKSKFNSTMRMRIYQFFTALWKNSARRTADRPHGTTSKYLDAWRNDKHRVLSSERVVDGKVENGQGKIVSAAGYAHKRGWHKAADVLLGDLYIVWRALEGLPVWCGYYEAKLGVPHGHALERVPGHNVPRVLTLDDALAIVGDVGPRAADAPILGEDPEPVDDADEAVDEAAE